MYEKATIITYLFVDAWLSAYHRKAKALKLSRNQRQQGANASKYWQRM